MKKVILITITLFVAWVIAASILLSSAANYVNEVGLKSITEQAWCGQDEECKK